MKRGGIVNPITMRKIVLPMLTAFLCLFVLCGCEVENMSSLPDLSRPYLGVYECEELSLGGEDMTQKFEFVRLELLYGGNFQLSYRTATGSEGGYSGEYEMKEDNITFTAQYGVLRRSFTFPVEKGSIFIDYNLNGRLLHAQFKMP